MKEWRDDLPNHERTVVKLLNSHAGSEVIPTEHREVETRPERTSLGHSVCRWTCHAGGWGPSLGEQVGAHPVLDLLPGRMAPELIESHTEM